MMRLAQAALVWLCLALAAAAQSLPDWNHTSVNDFARVLTPDDTRVIDQALIRLFDETDIEGTVVTLNDRASFGGGDGLRPFATRLFNDWGVGDADRNDGFMLLVLVADREVRIEVGAGYPPAADRVAQGILDDTVLPAFRAGQMSAGIRDGTLAIIDQIARPSVQGGIREEKQSWPELLAAIFGFGVTGIVAFGIGSKLLGRFRKARQPCPQCGGRGLVEEVEPVTATTSDGKQVQRQSVWTRCRTCGWSRRSMRDAPVRSRMRSRGGGFGGGRSSGGGASGRW